MYLKEKPIKVIKVINNIFTTISVLFITISAYIISSLLVYYSDRIETALNAKAMPDAVTMAVSSIIYLVISYAIKHLIGDAHFYSGYFENDLDGTVECSDLSQVTGKNTRFVASELAFLKKTFMKNFQIVSEGGNRIVKLESKKVSCQCKNCGAYIEKSEYYVGKCPYCESYDLHAKIITDNRFYCIENDADKNYKKRSSYVKGNLSKKRNTYIILLSVFSVIAILLVLSLVSDIRNYNDKDYLREVLLSPDNHLKSYDLIKADILDSIMFAITGILVLMPVIVFSLIKVDGISTALKCSDIFISSNKPFFSINQLPEVSSFSSPKGKMKAILSSIKFGYLTGCTFEKFNNNLRISLAKQVVKDKCPYCGAVITGVVDEHHKCKYCGNIVMDVLAKR